MATESSSDSKSLALYEWQTLLPLLECSTQPGVGEHILSSTDRLFCCITTLQCGYIYIHIYMWLYTYIYIYVAIYIYIDIHIHIHTYKYIKCVCMCVSVCVYKHPII